jgi:peptidyl-prolyl cis-trans isomerase C
MEHWQVYTRLTLALSLYRQPPWQLTAEQTAEFERQFYRQVALESRIEEQAALWELSADESDILTALAALDSRVADQAEWPSHLQRTGLDRQGLYRAMRHQVVLEKTLERVGRLAPAPDEQQVAEWYRQHRDRFVRPEQRHSSHILLTVDEDQADCQPEHVRGRMAEIYKLLQDDSGRFASLAQQHSQCPTALDGGNLGWISRGLLYESLDDVLFVMPENSISEVIESPMGLHILYCREIRQATTLPAEQALASIRRQFQAKLQQQHQRLWLKTL